MTTPEKRGINVNPLRVLVDPTALPRDGFRVDRKVGLLMSGAEGCLAATAIYLVTPPVDSLEFGIYAYLLLRMAVAAATYMTQQVGK